MGIDIDNMIQTIRKRPGMFLGREEITPLLHYINGYRAAEWDSNNGVCIMRGIVPLDFNYFNEYIRIKTKGNNARSWAGNILEYCNGDEHKALGCFFDFYDDFRKVRAEYYIKSVLTEENISCHDNMERGYRSILPGENISFSVSCHNNMECVGKTIDFPKAPMYSDPVSVYIIKLNIPAYLVLVETQKNIVCTRRLYTSIEKATKDHELYCFGEIKFEDKITGSVEFEKDIIID